MRRSEHSRYTLAEGGFGAVHGVLFAEMDFHGDILDAVLKRLRLKARIGR